MPWPDACTIAGGDPGPHRKARCRPPVFYVEAHSRRSALPLYHYHSACVLVTINLVSEINGLCPYRPRLHTWGRRGDPDAPKTPKGGGQHGDAGTSGGRRGWRCLGVCAV